MAQRLPLDAVHRAAGAAMAEAWGWDAPAHYGSPDREYRSLREGTGLIDRSMVGKAAVTGRDRVRFLQGMLTNDVAGLAPGQGCAAALLDAHGKVQALLRVYVLEDRLLLELPPGLTVRTVETIDRFVISEKVAFEAADAALAVLALQGPGAAELLGRLTGETPVLEPHQHGEREIAGASVRVAARPEAGVPGFHCWTAAPQARALWQALAEAGAAPVGLQALDVLRVEAGVPWYGRDVDDTVILPETRLEELVSYTKGCYIGQEVVARVKYRGHVNRALAGLVLEGERGPAPGARIIGDDREVGRITSAVWSPALGRPIALGYVRREHLEPGSAVLVEDGSARTPARVAALPFVK